MLQAYILVNRIHFSYSDVKKMTRMEREYFLEFYSDDMKRMSEGPEPTEG